jgi:ribosome-binding protein aMBF1 (putative translation factor)
MERDREAIRRLLERTRQDDGLSFPERLQGQIKQRGWARWRTAEALGVSQRTLSRWLAGMVTPRRRDLDRLAQVFGELPPLTPPH